MNKYLFKTTQCGKGVRSGTLKPMAVLPLVNARTFSSKITLIRMNVTIRTCWAAGLVVMKPDTSRMTSLVNKSGQSLSATFLRWPPSSERPTKVRKVDWFY